MDADQSGRPEPQSGILDIAPYIPGKSKGVSGVKTHKLSSNESPLGCSPAARDALVDIARHLELYPDGSASDLREAIAEVHGLHPGRIVCGAGSDELLTLLAQAYLGVGDEAIYSQHGFLVYPIAIKACGATSVVVPETDFRADVDEILKAVTDKTRMVFLANPNNPTGTYLPFDEIRRLHAGLPQSVLLVLDAAYAEYVRRNDYDSGLELVSGSQNVVMTRTFSKVYGLANLRVGWMFAPEHVVDVINRIRGPFNMNGPAIAAGAAAIRDQDFLEKAVAHNDRWLSWTFEALTELGLTVTPSVGNFILIHFPDKEGCRAADADAYLSARGFVLRQVGAYGLPNALRMSIGDEEANRGAVAALSDFLSPSTNV